MNINWTFIIIYFVGLIPCLIYTVFFHEDESDEYGWLIFSIFAIVGWYIILPAIALILTCYWLVKLRKPIFQWRKNLFAKIKNRKKKELSQLPVSTQMPYEQVVPNYRTPANCSECGK